MHYNGEHIDFLKSLKDKGRPTALDDVPTLDEDGIELWQVYCFIGENVLLGMDVYANRIGLPDDWEFEQCILLIADMQKKKRELTKAEKE